MKAKNGYKEQKYKYSTGRWLKRYFERRTCRKRKRVYNENKLIKI